MQRLRRGQVKGDAEEVKEEVAVDALERVAAAEADGVLVDSLVRVSAADCALDRVETTDFDGV